jgi:hypothetical protein
MAVLTNRAESRRLPGWLVAGVPMGLLLAVAILPAICPITLVSASYHYVIVLEPWAPPSPNTLYPDPELRLGPWRYRVTYWPRIGVR